MCKSPAMYEQCRAVCLRRQVIETGEPATTGICRGLTTDAGQQIYSGLSSLPTTCGFS
jgi:hypothetical protein